MKRTTKSPSKVFANVLLQAEKKLLVNAGGAENFEHRGLRGGERADALVDFMRNHLPGTFSVGRGEVIDYKDNRSGELDIFIFDQSTCAPIQASSETRLIPAEALYAVIEVKSVLTQDEMEKSFRAALRVRTLKPFKSSFIAAPIDGSAQEEHYRCPYYLFAYSSNLGAVDWAQKEFDRAKRSAQSNKLNVDLIDRIIVIDRGIIHPQLGMASSGDEATGLFLEFYIHLVNFLNREKRRRPIIDWQAYSSRRKWARLT